MKNVKKPSGKGHYSPVVEHNGILYVSGQVPTDPVTGKVPETIEEQVKLVFSKIESILSQAGSSLGKVLQVRIFMVDIDLWDAVNTTYAGIFGDHKPARIVIPCGELHYGSLLEAEVVAFI